MYFHIYGTDDIVALLTLSLIYTLSDASAADGLLKKHSHKRKNCSKQAISPFASMCSTLSHRLSIQL